jgi:hypothetical protein
MAEPIQHNPAVLEAKLDRLESDPPILPSSVDYTLNNPELVRERFGHVFNYFGRTEGEVALNTKQLEAILPNADDHTKRFIGVWMSQELPHGQIFDQLQVHLGLEPAVVDPNDVSPWLHVAGSVARLPKMHDAFMMLYLSRGAMHERLTAAGYRSLEKQLLEIGEPDFVNTALKPIERQEAGHLGYYQAAAQAKRRELAPWQLGLVRGLTARTYKPVGVRSEEHGLAFGRITNTLVPSKLDDFVEPVQRIANKLLMPAEPTAPNLVGRILHLLQDKEAPKAPRYVIDAVEDLSHQAA